MPANGETATVTTNPSVPVDISLNLLKREMALRGKLCLALEAMVGVCLTDTLRRNEMPWHLFSVQRFRWIEVQCAYMVSVTVQIKVFASLQLHKGQSTTVTPKCHALYNFICEKGSVNPQKVGMLSKISVIPPLRQPAYLTCLNLKSIVRVNVWENNVVTRFPTL